MKQARPTSLRKLSLYLTAAEYDAWKSAATLEERSVNYWIRAIVRRTVAAQAKSERVAP